jgi:hypothetical protein
MCYRKMTLYVLKDSSRGLDFIIVFQETSYTEQFMESISSTFYEQLFQAQIPEVQKDSDDLTVLLCFWDLRA